MTETSAQVLGQQGEDAACRWYIDQGYRIVDRNWRVKEGEIDVIASGDGQLVFCEVKTRSSSRYGLPSEAVGYRKQTRLRRLAAAWLAQNPGHKRVRFDVASVMGNQVDVIENAF